MAIADADYNFVAVDIGSFGSVSDGGVLASSNFGKAFQQGRMAVPPPALLPDAPHLGRMPYVLVADEAFPLKSYMLRPFPGRGLPQSEKVCL